jgi:2-amino-4-hydroxy-6-hydroxymethyldihydropteridine diphosphokinase
VPWPVTAASGNEPAEGDDAARLPLTTIGGARSSQLRQCRRSRAGSGRPARLTTAPHDLAIGLGANLGDPLRTLIAVRPLLEGALACGPLRLRWSPLFRTAPVGGPPGQPPYLNAVLLAEPRRPADPLALLTVLQRLETRFGRQRRERWGPRSLDLDLLWSGAVEVDTPELTLPHPRLLERGFVLAPLAALDPGRILAGAAAPVDALLAQLLARPGESPPERLDAQPGWPE